MNKLMKT